MRRAWLILLPTLLWAVWGVGAAGAALHADDWSFLARSRQTSGFGGALTETVGRCGLHRCLGFAGVVTAMAWAGGEAAWLRAIQVSGHAAAALAAALLAWRWGAGRVEAGLAALVFALCPSGWNAVTWPSTGYAPWAAAAALTSLAAWTEAVRPGARPWPRAGLVCAYALLYAAAVLLYEAVYGVVLMAVIVAVFGTPAQRAAGRWSRLAWALVAIVPCAAVTAAVAATQPAGFQWHPSATPGTMARTAVSIQYHLLDHVRLLEPGWLATGVEEWFRQPASGLIVVFLAVASGVAIWRRSEPPGDRAWVWRAAWGLLLAESFYAVYVLRGAMDSQSRHRYAAVAGLALLLATAAVAWWRRAWAARAWRAAVAVGLPGGLAVLALLSRGITSQFEAGTVAGGCLLKQLAAQSGLRQAAGIVLFDCRPRSARTGVPEGDMRPADTGWVLEEYTRHVAGLDCPVVAGDVVMTPDGFLERRHPERFVARSGAAVFVWDEDGLHAVHPNRGALGQALSVLR